MRVAFAIFVSALLGHPCQATVCVQQAHVVRQNVIQVQPAQAFFFVAPPSYYGTTAHGASQQAAATDYDAANTDRELVDAITKLVSAVTRLDARLTRLEQAQGIPAPPPEPEPAPEPTDPVDQSAGLPVDPVRVINDNCRFCHGSDNLAGNKGGFSLSQMWRDQRKIDQAIEMVSTGHMPATGDGSPAAIDPAQREVILSALEQIKRSQP